MSLTSSRSTASRDTPGSPRKSRTTRLVERLRSQTAGRDATSSQRRGRATTSDHDSARWRARRLGASSPRTRVRNERIRVTATIATVSAASPANPSRGINGSARVTAAVADAKKPGQCDPDLDSGKEAVGVGGQPGDNLARATAPVHRPHLGVPQRDQSDLAARQGAVQQHQRRDQRQLGYHILHPYLRRRSSAGG
jgi:hypothetical protein